MGFNLAKSKETTRIVEAQQKKAEMQRDDTFRTKVALQQFMNLNGPIFRAFANKGIQASDVMKSGVLNELIKSAVALATQTAAHVYAKDPAQVTAAEVRPFRVGAAEWVAAHWARGRQLNIDHAAEQLASAARLAGASWDSDIYKDSEISESASAQITGAAVAGTLFECVANYSFRQEPRKVLVALIEAVMRHAHTSAKTILPNATSSELQNITQTLARNLSNQMLACYDQTAREVLKTIKDKPEAEKIAYLAEKEPVNVILKNFEAWASWLSWIAPIAANSMMKPGQSISEPEFNGPKPE